MIAKFKKNRKPPFLSPFLIILALFIIGFLSFSNLKINQKRTELNSQIAQLEKEIQFLKERNQELKAKIDQTSKESYWEEKIREQGYKKIGEEAVVVLPPEKSERTLEEKSLWQKILEKIGL